MPTASVLAEVKDPLASCCSWVQLDASVIVAKSKADFFNDMTIPEFQILATTNEKGPDCSGPSQFFGSSQAYMPEPGP